MVGVVGALQLDVLQSRLEVEYGVPAGFDGRQWQMMRWVTGDGLPPRSTASPRPTGAMPAQDHDGELVAFFGSDWRRKRAEEEWPMLRFHAVREQHGLVAARR